MQKIREGGAALAQAVTRAHSFAAQQIGADSNRPKFQRITPEREATAATCNSALHILFVSAFFSFLPRYVSCRSKAEKQQPLLAVDASGRNNNQHNSNTLSGEDSARIATKRLAVRTWHTCVYPPTFSQPRKRKLIPKQRQKKTKGRHENGPT